MKTITTLFAVTALLFTTQFANAQEPAEAAPKPTYPAAGVIPFYCNSYDNNKPFDLLTKWGLSKNNFVDVEIGDDAALHMINLEWSAFECTGNNVNVNDYDYLHVDLYPDEACPFVVGIQNYWPGEQVYSADFQLKANQWNAIDIPLADLNWTVGYNHVINVIRLGDRDTHTHKYAPNIYMSNLFVYKESSPNAIGKAQVETSFNVFPTAVVDNVNFSSEESINTVKVYGVSGQLVGDYEMNGQNQLNLSVLQSGSYIVSAQLGNGEVVSKRIVKL